MGSCSATPSAVEGSNWVDVENVELPRLPAVGDAIETKYGTCVVVRTEPVADEVPLRRRIFCRLP